MQIQIQSSCVVAMKMTTTEVSRLISVYRGFRKVMCSKKNTVSWYMFVCSKIIHRYRKFMIIYRDPNFGELLTAKVELAQSHLSGG